MVQMNRRYPRYPDDADYQTNSPSYYDDLARKTKLIKLLSQRIWEYDEELAKRFEEWDKNLEEFDENVLLLLNEWLTDGTLERIINEEIFSTKADKEEMEKELLNHLIQLNRLNRIKLGGGVSVKLSDLDEEVINFLTDGGTVTIEGTPSDYSVTPIKTTFLYVSENIFDPEKMKDGYTVNDQGEMVESLNFSTSEFIPVNRNSIY